MPIYEVQDPESGITLELEGDSPPSEAELDQIFAEYQQPKGNALDAVFEPIQAVAGGALNQAASGLAGLGTLINTSDNKAANRAIEQTQAALPDFAPETKAGQKGLQTLGDLMQAGVDLVNVPISGLAGLASLIGGGGMDSAANTVNSIQEKGLGETLGNNTFEATGSPGLATAAQLAPDLGMAVLGGKTVQAGINKGLARLPKSSPKSLIDEAGKFRPDFKKALESQGVTLESIFPEDLRFLPEGVKGKKAADLVIKRKLKAGDTDGFLAGKKLDESGKIVDDDLAKAAMAQDFQAGDIQAIKSMSDATKNKLSRMIKTRRKIKDNTLAALEEQPTNVIGEAAFDRVMTLRDEINGASKKLDGLVKGRLGKTPVDVKSIATKFAEELKALKVSFNNGKLDFKGSRISKDDAAKGVIEDALDLMNEPGGATALRAHEIKKQLDNMINYKRSASSLTPAGEGLVKNIRKELNEAIRKVDPEYGDLNDTMHKSLTAIDDFESSMGAKFSIWDDNAASKAGIRLRKMLTRYGVSDDQISAIRQLDDTAQELGYTFGDDIEHLTIFNRILEDRFGSVRRGSLGPEIEKSMERMARGREGMKDAVIDAVIDPAAKYLKKKILDQSDYEAFRTLDQLAKTPKGKLQPLRSQATRRQRR